MTRPRTIEARVGGVKVTVPVYQDEETTRKIIDQVNTRLQEIETSSTRIDTTVFALKAAISFAVDLQDAQADHVEETKETILALDAVAEALRSILNQEDAPE